MFYNYRRKLLYWRFNRAISGVMDTPPLQLREAPWTIVSMVAPNHLMMYLLCLKALYRRLGRGRVRAIVTRAAPPGMLETLRRHVPGIELQVQEEIDTGPCQQGGTWERLLHILDLAEDRYVVQMDADILAFGPDLSEIAACIAENRAFVLADDAPLLPLPEAAAQAREAGGDYVGIASERLFDRYPGAAALSYVRGSSGFAGFALGGFPRAAMERFHMEMEALMGARWREWGTEQCASNFAIANSPQPVLLPHPAYTNYVGGAVSPATKCLHLLGTHRFENGIFASRGKAEIAALKNGDTL